MSRFPILRWGCAALALGGFFAWTLDAAGQTAQTVSARAGQRMPRAFPAPVDGQIKLSLDEAISLALANNQDLNVTVNAAEATDYELVANEGIFDPVLSGFANRNHQDSPSSNQLSGAFLVVQDTYNYGAQVQQLAPWGGTFTLGTSGGRFSTNSQFYNISGINPSYNAGLTITFSQPLLRNFGFTATKWQIYIAKNTRDAAYQQYVRSVQTTVNNVEQAYWDLVYTIQNLDVKRESLRIAQDLNRITQDQDRRRLARSDRHHADRGRRRPGRAGHHHGRGPGRGRPRPAAPAAQHRSRARQRPDRRDRRASRRSP